MSVIHLSAFQPPHNEQVEYLHLQELLVPVYMQRSFNATLCGFCYW